MHVFAGTPRRTADIERVESIEAIELLTSSDPRTRKTGR